MWMCPKCGCVEVVIYAENTGERCVAPMCTGTRGKAKDAYKHQFMYEQMYKVKSMLDNRLRVFSSGRLINDVPEVTVPRVPTGNGETQVPDPNADKTYAPWICQEYNSHQDACNTINLLLRVPNNKDWCANPRCTGERAEAVEAVEAVEAARAYGDNLEEYKAKFAAAVEAVRLVVRHNKPLATSLVEKRAEHQPVTVREIAKDNQRSVETAHLGHIQKQREASFIGFVVPEVPRLVKECVDELMRRILNAATFPQGLFRVPGNDFKIETLLRAYQENRPVVLEKEAPNDIAGLLKRFFMQLQTPLLGSKHENLEDLAELSDGHKLVLRYILPLLRTIANNTETSLLDANTLATSIACIAEKTDTQKTQEKAALARSGQPVYSDSLEAITQEAAAIKRRLSFIARVISESADVDAILNMTTIRKPVS